MKKEELEKRIKKCLENKLCFISLEPLIDLHFLQAELDGHYIYVHEKYIKDEENAS